MTLTSARVATTPAGAATILRTTTAVRERANQLLRRARAGESRWFSVDDTALASAAAAVADVTVIRYPNLEIPFHSRWRHFEAGGVDRNATLDSILGTADSVARARIDLAVVSVLLDAGAGPDWSYVESGRRFARSEGLAVASWHAFVDGVFSSDPADPLRVDASRLCALDAATLARAFQVSASNPLVGLDGRVALLRRLGGALGADGRPGQLWDALAGESVSAGSVLAAVLDSFSGIWPADNAIDAEPLGDCWRHDAVDGPGLTQGWMPFHKLSQWLTYSLLEPLEWSGVTVTDLDALTALPEYRNGGLLLDTGVLRLRDPQWARRTWDVGDELVVEWRALTVALLDELAMLVRKSFDMPDLPLACVLEGGTWAAGRQFAQHLRGGLPPLTIDSDGTVF